MSGSRGLYQGGVPVAEVVRSGFVESRHYGSVAVLDADGRLVASVGHPHGAIMPRSSNKPMQVIAMLRAGLTLSDPADVSLAAGSHCGEPFHVERVRAMLRLGGFGADDLRCPPDYPLADDARDDVIRAGGHRERVYMNCSGKHAAMLLTCAVADWPTSDYLQPGHPVQVACLETIADLAEESVAAVAVDGCGAAAHAVSLTGLARAYLAAVAAKEGTPERAVADAMRAHPELMSGTARDDARLMHGLPGLLAKGGAEGVIAVAVPDVGAVALKIDDGGQRARLPVLVRALRLLGVDGLDDEAELTILGGGLPVGVLRAVF